MNKKLNLALIALLAFGTGAIIAQANYGVVCTTETKLCPNGTSVGRTGPSCEFNSCDSTSSTGVTSAPVSPDSPNSGGESGTNGRPYKKIIPCAESTGASPCVNDPRHPSPMNDGRFAPSAGPLKDNLKNARTIDEIRARLRNEMRDNRLEGQNRMNTLRSSTTETRANIKDEMQKKRLEFAKKQAQLIIHRLNAAVERVQKLSDRVSIAIDSLSAKGVDVSASSAHIADVKVKLDEARTKITAVKSAFDTAFAGQTPKESLKEAVEPLVKDTAKTIQEAHNNVAQAISSIKKGLNKPRSATTTGTTTQ